MRQSIPPFSLQCHPKCILSNNFKFTVALLCLSGNWFRPPGDGGECVRENQRVGRRKGEDQSKSAPPPPGGNFKPLPVSFMNFHEPLFAISLGLQPQAGYGDCFCICITTWPDHADALQYRSLTTALYFLTTPQSLWITLQLAASGMKTPRPGRQWRDRATMFIAIV